MTKIVLSKNIILLYFCHLILFPFIIRNALKNTSCPTIYFSSNVKIRKYNLFDWHFTCEHLLSPQSPCKTSSHALVEGHTKKKLNSIKILDEVSYDIVKELTVTKCEPRCFEIYQIPSVNGSYMELYEHDYHKPPDLHFVVGRCFFIAVICCSCFKTIFDTFCVTFCHTFSHISCFIFGIH